MLTFLKSIIKRHTKTNRDPLQYLQKLLQIANKSWSFIAFVNITYFLAVYALPLYTKLSVPYIPAKSLVENIILLCTLVVSSLLMWQRITLDKLKLDIDDFLLIVSYGKSKIATCCLDITSIPGSVILESDSIPKYNTAILLAIREGLCKKCNITYEASIINMQPSLRIFISSIHQDISVLREILHKEATRIEAILLASLGNVELELIKGRHLIDAVTSLSTNTSLEDINHLLKNEMDHQALLVIAGSPSISPTQSSSQIGTLISTALRQGDSIRFVCTFSKASVNNNRKAMESQWKHIREREKRKEDTLADQISKRKLIKEFDEMHDNVGWFNTSTYVLCTSHNEKERRIVINRVSGLILSIWGGNGHLTIKELPINTYRLVRIITRRHLFKTRMHASRLAAFVNTPVQYTPAISPVETPVFSTPSLSFTENEINIGHVVYGGRKINKIGLKIEWLREHVAILGATGTGKTTLVKRIMAQLSKKTRIPWWIFDVKGSEYIELVQKVDQSILVIKPGFDSNFSLSILETKNDDTQYAVESTFQLLRELLKEHNTSSELTPAMERLLHESLTKLTSSEDQSITNLMNIIQSLSRNKEFSDMTRDALLNRLQIITRNPLNTIFNTNTPTKLADLLNRRVIFDLSYVARKGGLDTARFLYNLVAKRIFDNAMRRGIKQGLHHVIVLEEANNLVPESYTRSSSADVTTGESMVLLQRATGQGVIVVSTRPNISSNILANTATKIMFRLPYDSSIGARFLSLNNSQERYLRTLRQGQAIVVMPRTEAFEIITEPTIIYDYELNQSHTDSKTLEYESEISESENPAKESAKVFDRNLAITTHVVAWLAAKKMATENQLVKLLQSLNSTIDIFDAQEIIGELVSIGSIERESIPLVEGGAIFTLPGNGSESIRTIILDFICEHLYEDNKSDIKTDAIDLIIDDTAIMIIPEHITSSLIHLVIQRIRSVMIELGHQVSRLIVIVRGSVAAAKIREILMKMNEFDAVSILSAFPSALEKLCEELNQSIISSNKEFPTFDNSDLVSSVDLIDAVHDVSHASHREIQMRLWTSLLQEFVESSGGKLKWQRLLNFIETTSIQSLKGRTIPLKVEDGRRALTELLADDVLIAIRFTNNQKYDNMDAGLWVVNSTVLENIRNTIIALIIEQLAQKGINTERGHGYFDLCDTHQSYIIFPTQDQLKTVIDYTESTYCRICNTSGVLCIMPASEYIPEDENISDNCRIVSVDLDLELILNTI